VSQFQQILGSRHGCARRRGPGQPDQVPGNVGGVRGQILAGIVALSLCGALLVPAQHGVVVVGSGVDDPVGRVVVVGELISFAQTLSLHAPGRTAMVIPGKSINDLASQVAETTGIDIIALENPHLDRTNTEVLNRAISDLAGEYNAEYICLLHSIRGIHIASALSIKMESSCIASVESVHPGENGPVFRRPVFGGKLITDAVSKTEKTILTILPGAFPPGRNLFYQFNDTLSFRHRRKPLGGGSSPPVASKLVSPESGSHHQLL